MGCSFLVFQRAAVVTLSPGMSLSIRHSGGSRNLGRFVREQKRTWMPAFAGRTDFTSPECKGDFDHPKINLRFGVIDCIRRFLNCGDDILIAGTPAQVA